MVSKLNSFSILRHNPRIPENTLMLVGTALNGPSGVPFEIKEDKDPFDVLGVSPLSNAVYAARKAGAEHIVAFRVNGTHSEAEVISSDGNHIATLRAVSATGDGDDISVMAYPTHLYVTNTDGTEMSYFFDRHKTLEELAYAINRDAQFGMLEFQCEIESGFYQKPTDDMFHEIIDIMFSGGDEDVSPIHERGPGGTFSDEDEVTYSLKPQIERALFGDDIKDIRARNPEGELGSIDYAVLCICDIAHEDDPEYAEMISQFAKRKTEETNMGCVAVIGTRPVILETVYYSEDEGGKIQSTPLNDDEAWLETREHSKELEELSNSRILTDSYPYIQVVDGYLRYIEIDAEFLSAAYAYAATQASLPFQTIMTNKGLSGSSTLSIQKSKEDIAMLSDSGYICIIPSVRRGIVPYRSVSYGWNSESLVSKPHNMRISQYVTKSLRDALDGLIGESQTELSIDEVMVNVDELMVGFVVQKAVQNYAINPVLSDFNRKLTLQVTLWLFSEVESVTLVTESIFPKGVGE